MPNMSVRVLWDTTLQSDSEIFWRNAPINNMSALSGWASSYINESVTAHEIIINGTDILEHYFYEYYAKSNYSGTVYTSDIQNFTVGIIPLPIVTVPTEYENQTAPMVGTAVTRLEELTGVPYYVWLSIIAIFSLIVMSIAGFLVTQEPFFGIAIFITGLIMFTLFGFLPYYVLIIIGLIFAFILVKFVKGLVD